MSDSNKRTEMFSKIESELKYIIKYFVLKKEGEVSLEEVKQDIYKMSPCS
jgi:hypothetical protein